MKCPTKIISLKKVVLVWEKKTHCNKHFFFNFIVFKSTFYSLLFNLASVMVYWQEWSSTFFNFYQLPLLYSLLIREFWLSYSIIRLGCQESSCLFEVKPKRRRFNFLNTYIKLCSCHSPFCWTTFLDFLVNLKISSFHRISQIFQRKTFLSDCFISTKELKFFQLSEFCNAWNLSKLEGARSGESSGSSRISQLNPDNFCRVIIDTRGRA